MDINKEKITKDIMDNNVLQDEYLVGIFSYSLKELLLLHRGLFTRFSRMVGVLDQFNWKIDMIMNIIKDISYYITNYTEVMYNAMKKYYYTLNNHIYNANKDYVYKVSNIDAENNICFNVRSLQYMEI